MQLFAYSFSMRKLTASATSDGSPKRPEGMRFRSSALADSSIVSAISCTLAGELTFDLYSGIIAEHDLEVHGEELCC